LVPFFLPHGVYPTDRQTGGRRDTGPTLYACRRDERGQCQMHTLVEQIRRRLALDSVCAAHQRPTKTTLMQRLWCSVGDVITYGPRRAGAAGQTRTYVRTHQERGGRMGSRRQRCAVADILTPASARVRSRQTTGVRRWSVSSLVTMSTKLTLFSRATRRSRHPTKLLKKCVT